ncbi:MAG: lipopolysaccharide biosynthesis protein [Limisphaerales bacterium]
MSDTDASADLESKKSFFRQSGWMVISTFLMGVCMLGIHPLCKKLSNAEYEIALTMLSILQLMSIPAGALQMAFARQTSAAITEGEQKDLAGTFHAIMKFGTVVWLLFFLFVAWRMDWILATLRLTNPAGVWCTCAAGLTLFWWAVAIGVVQGRQNFLWYGFASIFNGFGRIGIALAAVLYLGWGGSGIMFAAWMGLTVSALTVLWHSRDLFTHAANKVKWNRWLADIVPLVMAGAIIQIFMSVDRIIVKARLPSGFMADYGVASTLVLGMVGFIGPIAAVMFPKIVRSARLEEKSNALSLTVLTTAVVSIAGAIALSFLAPIMIEIGFDKKFLGIKPLVPWYVVSMVPLCLTNVLIAHLLATKRNRAIACLLLIAIAYAVTLSKTVPMVSAGDPLMPVFKQVVWTLGGFNLLLLTATSAICYFGRQGDKAD